MRRALTSSVLLAALLFSAGCSGRLVTLPEDAKHPVLPLPQFPGGEPAMRDGLSAYLEDVRLRRGSAVWRAEDERTFVLVNGLWSYYRSADVTVRDYNAWAAQRNRENGF